LNPFEARVGSIPYGLPCLAVTRRNLDVQLRQKQVEIINWKLIKIMQAPNEYIDFINEEDKEN